MVIADNDGVFNVLIMWLDVLLEVSGFTKIAFFYDLRGKTFFVFLSMRLPLDVILLLDLLLLDGLQMVVRKQLS
jgi:hypothetical protein